MNTQNYVQGHIGQMIYITYVSLALLQDKMWYGFFGYIRTGTAHTNWHPIEDISFSYSGHPISYTCKNESAPVLQDRFRLTHFNYISTITYLSHVSELA